VGSVVTLLFDLTGLASHDGNTVHDSLLVKKCSDGDPVGS